MSIISLLLSHICADETLVLPLQAEEAKHGLQD